MSKNLVIITSKENFVWTSMTEIIPWIEHAWSEWAHNRGIPVSIIDIDSFSMSAALKALMNAELAVVTCFNLKMAKFLTKLRSELSIDVKMAFYLHNQATIGCWPLMNWKLIEYMNQNDVFIGTCRRDVDTMKLNFLNAETKIIPFSLNELPKRQKRTFKSDVRKLAFIGRISAQKNLHTLIWALGLLKEQGPDLKWEFHLFGKDDELGSPLMGLPQMDYEAYLKKLIDDLGLTDRVKLRGFLNREDIEAEMNADKWINVSPSLHGDENFGMAAFRCLINGHLSVLSDWGGHSDFFKYFPKQTHAVRVYQGEYGPWIDAFELAQALVQAMRNDEGFDESVSYFGPESLMEKMDEVWNREAEAIPLFPTPLAQDILKKRHYFVEIQEKLILQNKMQLKETQRWSQIFEDYRDKTAHAFHKAYGMENLKFVSKNSEFVRAPWARETKVFDPHRGNWNIENKDDSFLAENGWATAVRRFV